MWYDLSFVHISYFDLFQSPSPVMCPSPEYLYSYSPAPPYELVGYVPLEPPGPRDDEIDNASNTAAIIASQSQDYVDEKLAEYQATIQQLQGKSTYIYM